MKKTLIALAAVAVTSTAFAQNVTISGRIDIGSASTKTTNNVPNTTAKSDTLAGAHGTKTASRITFAGTEDLGGGLTAFFNTETALNGGAMSARNLFVGVRGGFGSVQAGRFLNSFSPIRDGHYSIAGGAGGGFLNQHLGLNSNAGNTITKYGLTATALQPVFSSASTTAAFSGFVAKIDGAGDFVPLFIDAGALGTGQLIGSVLQSTSTALTVAGSSTMATAISVGDLNAATIAANLGMAADLNALMNAYGNRSNNALAYTTPKFGDFTLTVGIVNDKITSDRVGTGFEGTNQAKVSSQSYSLAYASGPLAARLTVGSGKVTLSREAVLESSTAAAVSARGDSKAKASDTALMVSYDLGVAQAYIMDNRTKSTLSSFRGTANNSTRKTNATEIGVKMPMGSFEPFVTVGRGDVKTTSAGVAGTATDIKTSAYQLGLNYNLSKRTVVYASTGQQKAKTTANTAKTTGYTFGLVHNF